MRKNINKYSIEEIASICNVSKATVSRVINHKTKGVGEETRERVQKVIEELNYRPNILARGVATARSSTVGVIVPDVSNFFYPKVIRGIIDYMDSVGYSVILGNSDYNPEKEAEQLLRMMDNRVDGIILCSGVSNSVFLEDFKKYKVPLGLLGRSFDSSLSVVSITGNNESGGFMSTNYLLSGGKKKVAYLEGKAEISGAMQRLRGYKKALQEAKIKFDPDLVLYGDYTVEFGGEAIELLLKKEIEFDAVMTGSDLIAIGVVSKLTERGIRVPEDKEVIGFDNIALSSVFHPPLTTISKPHYDMAYHLSEQLIHAIRGEKVTLAHTVVEPQLVIRETTKTRK